MVKRYIHRSVGSDELHSLVGLAGLEEQEFFVRNPHLEPIYRDRLFCVALCQGAALQYLGRGYGVNDFDIHFFYLQNPAKPRLSRAIKHVTTDVGAFKNVEVDFIRTLVPVSAMKGTISMVEGLQKFLSLQPSANAKHLAAKAVVGLLPKEVFGSQIWPPR